MFVKWSCGCKGIKLTPHETDPLKQANWCLWACDAEGYGTTCYRRPYLQAKTFEPLPVPETEELLEEIGGLVDDGYLARKMRGLLWQLLRNRLKKGGD